MIVRDLGADAGDRRPTPTPTSIISTGTVFPSLKDLAGHRGAWLLRGGTSLRGMTERKNSSPPPTPSGEGGAGGPGVGP